ncbi:MAG: type II toxin-antitoxin system VapC family toxin [SAR324 cluster bacterium]|nr:type II toxin-antitoxin system VapC family toxin [SAR324 cluster bacterium]MBF0351706.1 type II toxin-antitoxin system VapC family toxin [SAR324 cluster bacterium]
MMPYVLDACALIAFLDDEPGADVVDTCLETGKCYLHAINACEVYYDIWKKSGESVATTIVERLALLGIFLQDDMDITFWQQVGRLKAEIKRISLADCFAVVLAQKTGSTLLTSDHHEFDPIVPLNLCSIQFIR